VSVPDKIESKEKELPMREWVLEALENAGVDSYKAYSLISCESHWNPQATNVNYQNRAGVDMGLWQLNSHFQKATPACSYDYKCATKYAIKLIKSQGFKPWVCGKNL
jgi:hypothetical protein